MEHFGKYTLETVYLGTIEAQRQEIMHLWQTQGVLPDAAERLRRSHEAVVLVRNMGSDGLMVGWVELFYRYGFFIVFLIYLIIYVTKT